MGVTLRCKVAIVGNKAVGKTALTQMFQSSGSQFPKQYVMTAGADLGMRVVSVNNADASVELFLVDTSGHDVYRPHVAQFWKGVTAMVAVYDVGNRASFDSLESWISNVRELAGSTITGVIVANKADLGEQAAVPEEEGREKASELGFDFFQASAVNNSGVDEPFRHLAATCARQFDERAEAVEAL